MYLTNLDRIQNFLYAIDITFSFSFSAQYHQYLDLYMSMGHEDEILNE